MPITLRHEEGNVYRVDIRGTLRSDEFRRCQISLSSEMDQVGAVRLLICLDGFEAWQPGDDWRDLTFYMNRGDDIDRIAIVGHERWRSQALMFAAADLRRAPVEFFTDAAAALEWLRLERIPAQDPES